MSPSNIVKQMAPTARMTVKGARSMTLSQNLSLKPLAFAIGLLLLSDGAYAAGPRPFSGDWFTVKGATRASVTASADASTPVGMPPPLAQQQQANAQLQRSIANLGRTAAAIAAAQAMQDAARQAALNVPGSVPDGLTAGGLQTDTDPATRGWVNAGTPVQSTSGGHTTVSITQTGDKAILNWETFNVGKNTEVDFHQQSDWAVLNRVNDPDARPGQIEGQIKGDGTVLLINRNGIVFSGSGQVNVRNLVAAAANITDSQFTTSGIYSATAGSTWLPAFTGAAGQVLVAAGAAINTAVPESVTRGGGYVLLLGSEVHNAGQITAPKGQAELAAGDNFVIRQGYGTDANTFSTTRGNEVAPQRVPGSATTGIVENSGLLTASEGDITLAGHDVRQNGVAVSTTTVNQRGTIHLLNSASDATGSVTLGAGATTAVLQQQDGSTALDSQRDTLISQSAAQNVLQETGVFDNLSGLADRQDQSRIEIVTGGEVNFQDQSLTLATGGQLAVSAGPATGKSGEIYVAGGAQLDVSGATDVQVAMSSNEIQVDVQGNEQRDAPVNRDSGVLNNSKLWIDTRRLIHVAAGTGGYAGDRDYTAGGLLEVSGYLSNQGHTIGEWAAQGGTITLAGGSAVAQSGSVFNIAGGSEDVQGGYMQMSWLRGADGRLYEVNSAPADIAYTGVYQGFTSVHPRWGNATTEVYRNPLVAPQQRLENGYTVGRDAGTLVISTPTSIFEGDIVADVYNGPVQTQARPAGITDGYKYTQYTVAQNGTLAVGQYGALGRTGAFATDVRIGVIADITADIDASDALPADRSNTLWFDASRLTDAGLGGLSIASGKTIAVDADVTLASGGSVELVAPVIDVTAGITARAGSVTLTNLLNLATYSNNTVGSVANPLQPASGRATIILGDGATIDTRGLWTNVLPDPDADPSRLALTDGGTVTVRSTGDVTLAKGATIDASSGGAILATGKFMGGKGGDITLAASYVPQAGVGGNNGDLVFAGTVKSDGFTRGGALTLETGGLIVIGGVGYSQGDTLPAGTAAPYALTLIGPLTIYRGETLPFDTNISSTSIPPGGTISMQVLNVANNYGFQNPTADGSYSNSPRSDPSVLAVTQAPWTNIPVNMQYQLVGSSTIIYANKGDTIPQGARIFTAQYYGSSPFVIPADVFPDGINALGYIIKTAVSAGTLAPQDVTFAAGTTIPRGISLPRNIAVQPIVSSSLSADLFSSGFSAYTVDGHTGVRVADGVVINVMTPVLQLTAAGYAAPTGSDLAAFTTRQVMPLYLEDPLTATLTQRPGVDVTLRATNGSEGVIIGEGAAITVDAGRNITLESRGQITVEGSLIAPGGTVSLLDPLVFVNPANNGPVDMAVKSNSFWIGDDAVIDVAAQAYTALDAHGQRYGVVPDGGTINIGRVYGSGYDQTLLRNAAEAYIVILPGARLDASGTSGTLTLTENGVSRDAVVASDGGSISLRSYFGLYVEGSLRAASGGAAGGSLDLVLETVVLPNSSSTLSAAQITALNTARVLYIGEDAAPLALAGQLQPGQSDTTLALGQGSITARQIDAGGFDSVSLFGRNGLVFDGDVTLATGRSLTLGGSTIYAENGGDVALRAPSVVLQGDAGITVPPYYGLAGILPPELAGYVGDRLDIDAGFIDMRNTMTVHFADTLLTSTGDIRFQAPETSADVTSYSTTFAAPDGDLTLTAQQVYPGSGARVVVQAGYTPPPANSSIYTYVPGATLSIESVDGVVPDQPWSVFGSIAFQAPNVRQAGVVRAPLGAITFGLIPGLQDTLNTRTTLAAGSITSVSAAGLTMPYGGTTDGVIWKVDGGDPMLLNLLTGMTWFANIPFNQGVTLQGVQVVSGAGATIDLSGGGKLAGAGFISGRGGSVDVLTTPLISANPANTYSAAGNKVYAIVPGTLGNAAPGGATTAWSGDVPAIGQQITIPAGVPGLPAGTYTLLPANYALLPGAFRVELGATSTTASGGTASVGNGSYVVSGYQSVAGTAIRDVLPTQVIVTPGAAVRTYSDYNETDFSTFERAQASTFGTVRPALPEDGKMLRIALGALATSAPDAASFASGLLYAGATDFSAASGGYDGGLALWTTDNRAQPGYGSTLDHQLLVTADDSTAARSAVLTPVAASAIDAIGAANLFIGGSPSSLPATMNANYISIDSDSYYSSGSSIGNTLTLEGGAVLRGAQVVLAGGVVTLHDGAVIDTTGWGVRAPDTAATGYVLRNGSGAAVLVVSNGQLDLDPTLASSSGAIIIGDGGAVGPHIATDGSIGFLSKTGVVFNGVPDLAAARLALALPSINIGTVAALAAAGTLPTGMTLDQSVLNRLLAGVQNLTLQANDSINFYGGIGLDFGADHTLVLASPAIYGAGSADDTVTLNVGTLVWNGIMQQTGLDASGNPIRASATPGTTGGIGLGSGRFVVNAADIVFGYPDDSNPETTTTLDRLMLGFSQSSFNAADAITANNKGTLSVYQSGADPSTGYDAKTYAGTGGTLSFNTPLLTGAAGSILKVYAGGDVSVAGAPPAAKPSALGAEIDIAASGDVNLDTAVWLPGGRFSVMAAGDISLGAGSRIDLSGQTVSFFDATQYTWGGDVLLESTHGNITQAAGSVIDVSAAGSDAGSLTLTATDAAAGNVLLNGTLKATGGGGHNGGSFDLRAQAIGDPARLSADFAALNAALDTAGFTEGRSFDFRQGDLIIASDQSVKAHAVTISIDGGSLTVDGAVDASGARVGSIVLAARDDLAVNGLLDAHGTALDVDSKGAAIAANNAATIDLTTSNGTLRLNAGAVLDLSVPGGTAYGKLTLNAPRTAIDSGDVRISAAAPLDIRGARTIDLNAFWTYNLPGGSVITQTTLDGYDADSTTFMNAAFAGAALNPGLQAKLAGLTAYGPVFHLRPGVGITSTGDLSTSGDIDLAKYRYGPNADRDMNSASYGAGEAMALTIRAGGNLAVNGSISDGFQGTPGKSATPPVFSNPLNVVSSGYFTHGANPYGSGSGYFNGSTNLYITTDWTVPNDAAYAAFGGLQGTNGVTYGPGSTIPAGTQLSASWGIFFEDGLTWPQVSAAVPTSPGTPGTPAIASTSPLAHMLAPGSLSASIRLVSGADIAAASTKILTAAGALAGSGNLTLSDYHTTTDSLGNVVTAASVLRTGAGDLDLLAGGNISQDSIYNVSTNGSETAPADLTVRAQGSLTGYIYDTSSYVSNWLNGNGGTAAYTDGFTGFTGFGAMGAGRVTIRAGGDAGETVNVVQAGSGTNTTYVSTGLVVAARAGDVVIDIGGRLNPNGGNSSNNGPYAATFDQNGVFTALRGDLTLRAGAIGVLPLTYGLNEANDPRGFTPDQAALVGNFAAYGPQGAITLVAGDGVSSLEARGDLALGRIGAAVTASYWSDNTAVNLLSAGGNLVPVADITPGSTASNGNGFPAPNLGWIPTPVGTTLPPIFTAIAASGSIYYSGAQNTPTVYRLAPSANGKLELLAWDSIYGAAFAPSSTTLDMPARWEMASDGSLTLHDGDADPIRVYAATGDLVNVVLGESYTYSLSYGGVTYTAYVPGKAAQIEAGRDIVNFGRAGELNDTTIHPSLILNTDDTDVSVISAGRDIFYANVAVAGPGTLEVSAGRNLYQGNMGSIVSIGPLATGDSRPGASVLVAVGMGTDGADWSALYSYLDPANLAVSGTPLADQPGKVAATYQDELETWLLSYLGYQATSVADALATFEALPVEQQQIFLRTVYFAELKAGGREYNDPSSSRYGSYLRGREAIATLFPADRSYSGNLVMYGNSGIRTVGGGDISILTPGGQQVIGVEGTAPGASAGVLTQGEGDISLYSRDSILLGLSRIMTTFGGNILAWSAEGDINAGRGSKTTIVYTPPKRVYDDWGNVTLSPVVPSTGAGIATLAPIPEVPAGDIDLIAPLGTIDAGEAGIRVSGNVNIAALRVVNADNIQVQGKSSGLPTVAAVNVGALTAASQAASSAVQAAEQISRQAQRNQPSIINVQILGYGSERLESGGADTTSATTTSMQEYNADSSVQVLGAGPLSPSSRAMLTPTERSKLSM